MYSVKERYSVPHVKSEKLTNNLQ